MGTPATGYSQSLHDLARYAVTVEGDAQTVSQQLRLLPLSRNILCLPLLSWSPPTTPSSRPATTGYGVPEKPPASLAEIKASVLKLHSEHVERAQRAREWLDGERLVDGERRFVFYNGGVPSAKKACLTGIKEALPDRKEAEVEKLWEDIVKGGVQGLVPEEGLEVVGLVAEGNNEPLLVEEQLYEWPRKRSLSPSTQRSTPRPETPGDIKLGSRRGSDYSDGVKHSQTTQERKDSVSGRNGVALNGIRDSIALRPPTLEELDAGIEIGKASAVVISARSRGNTIVTKHSVSSLHTKSSSRKGSLSNSSSGSPPPLPNMLEELDGARKFRLSIEKRIDSAYSSGVSGIPTPPTPPKSAELREDSIDIDSFCFREPKQRARSVERPGSARSSPPSSRSPSPTPSSTADVSGATIIPSPSYSQVTYGLLPDVLVEPEVEPLFPPLEENLVINLSLEGSTDHTLEKLLSEEFPQRSPLDRRYTFHMSQTLIDPKYTLGQPRYSSQALQSPTSPRPPSQIGPLHATAVTFPPLHRITYQKSNAYLDIQNEIRALLVRNVPQPQLTTPTAGALDPVGWLLGSDEEQMWRPVLAESFKGHEDAICPGIDVIVAVGAEGRERCHRDLDETEKKGTELANLLSETFDSMGRNGSGGTRASRISLSYLLKSTVPHLVSHPGNTLTDISKGAFLLPALESYASQNHGLRIIVIDFDLSTGSDAILALHNVLPSSTFKICIVGDAAAQVSQSAAAGKRIYVRTSVGNTTTSFSALPSPVFKSRPIGRKEKTAKMRVTAAADWMVAPWADIAGPGATQPVEDLQKAVKERWRALGRWEERRAITPPLVQQRSREMLRSGGQGHGHEKSDSVTSARTESTVEKKVGFKEPRRASRDTQSSNGSLGSKQSTGSSQSNRSEVSYLDVDGDDDDDDDTTVGGGWEEQQFAVQQKSRGGPGKALKLLGLNSYPGR